MQELAKTERELMDTPDPWPKSREELNSYLDSLEKLDGYGGTSYACCLAAVAAFNYMSHVHGCTGFQASHAAMNTVRRLGSIKGPFVVLSAENCLYPQYGGLDYVSNKASKLLIDAKPWLKEEAARLLKETELDYTHPGVVAHWKKLANF